MPDLETQPRSQSPSGERLNVAERLTSVAAVMPDAIAVACPRRSARRYPSARPGGSQTTYATTTFAELDADVTRIARGLATWGVPPGTRLALLVRPGIDFVALVFALLRAGVVSVLIDPGMGRRNMLRRLAEVEPEGFVAVPLAQSLRVLLRRQFPRTMWNVTVGHRWGWGGKTLNALRVAGDGTRRVPATWADSPAAIIFTSGSTGPAKGVLYTHRMFDLQVSEIRSAYGIEPGGVDLSCFPLFALFNAAMGVTTVLPEIDFSRPAAADPNKLLAAANDWQVTQAFASPAVWRKLGPYGEQTGNRIPSLRQIFSCGAPVPTDVIRSTLKIAAPGASMHTPYGMTESLPVATIEAQEILNETAAKTDQGAGVCVGRKFDSIDWRIIRISDEPIATIEQIEELSRGEIGELIVRGPQVSPAYLTRVESNALSKIDGGGREQGAGSRELADLAPRTPQSSLLSSLPWHRTGDVGYLDERARFWYCGRKSQRVETVHGPLYTECVEAIFKSHPAVRRSALVGIDSTGKQVPVIVVERERSSRSNHLDKDLMCLAAAHAMTRTIGQLLVHPSFPVDFRHNSKINRELLAIWAAKRLGHSDTWHLPPG